MSSHAIPETEYRGFRKAHPITFLLLVWVVLPVGVLFGAVYVYLLASVPNHSRIQTVQALDGDVRVDYDEFDVPFIHARTDRDAFYVLGYLHAQNRMWQMEFRRRAGQGRLSELFGRSTLGADRYVRTLGLHQAAKSAFLELPQEAKDSLEAYVRGVNAWIAEDHVLPPEFQVFRATPELWSPVDSLLQTKLMALELGANYQDELRNQALIRHLGMERWRELVSFDESIQPSAVAHVHGELNLSGAGAGSNAWVVSGEFTKSGKPLLAGDPHLAGTAPSTFYLAELKGARLHVRGATLPGLPIVIFGQNANVAWAATNVRADVQDLFEERLHPENEQLHFMGGDWRPLKVRTEWIAVAPDRSAFLHEKLKPVKWQVRATELGPLISDVMGPNAVPMSLRWTALAERDNSYDSFLRINYAEDAADFSSALKDYVAPVLNFVYADTKGAIGSRVAGQIPVRKQGWGLMPLPDSAETNWAGLIAFDELPACENPSGGIIVTANDRIDSGGLFLSSNWQPPYRAKRIQQMITKALASGRKLEATDMAVMQRDKISLQAAELMPFLKSLRPENSRQARLLAQLGAWDREMDVDSPGAPIYHTWLRHFSRLLVEDDLAPDLVHERSAALLQSEVAEIRPVFLRHLMTGAYPQWCDDTRTPELETCLVLALRALDETYIELERLLGGNLKEWRWGDAQKVIYPHNPMSRIALLSRVFAREREVGGDSFTVDVAWNRPTQGEGYVKTLGASYRQVIDLGDPASSLFALDLGQSGNILSPHYDDWLAGFSGKLSRSQFAWRGKAGQASSSSAFAGNPGKPDVQ